MIEAVPPAFWNRPSRSLLSWMLTPLSWVWCAAGALRERFAKPYVSSLPVLCVGNVTLGGAGKTPAAIALAQALHHKNPCFLTRGYGGLVMQPVLVRDDNAARYGDEAVLLAHHAPVIVSPDRKAGLRLAEQSGFGIVIADDGLQNPHFAKTTSLLVFDGGVGIGNGGCVPAGPCREPLEKAKSRAQACIITGDDARNLAPRLAPLPVFHARMAPINPQPGRVVAFAGIGRPQKFFDTLRACGYDIAHGATFPDHHVYTDQNLLWLSSLAMQNDARLITTEKDAVRLPPRFRKQVETLGATLVIDDMAALLAALKVA